MPCTSSPVKSSRGFAESLSYFDKFIGVSETKVTEEFAVTSLFCACGRTKFDFLISFLFVKRTAEFWKIKYAFFTNHLYMASFTAKSTSNCLLFVIHVHFKAINKNVAR